MNKTPLFYAYKDGNKNIVRNLVGIWGRYK
jgi:hypothetical protein